MKLIPLTQGLCAIVKDEHFEWLNQWQWYAWKDPISGKFYAVRDAWVGKKRVNIKMARLLMNAPKGMVVDHWDGNTLNNDTDNLRLCTQSQNLCNRGPQKNSTSGFKGVSWEKSKNKWEAYITVNKRRKHVGYFDDKVEAAQARDAASIKYHGEFAWLNFPTKKQAA